MGFSEAGRLLAALLLVCSVVGAVPAGGGAGGGGHRAGRSHSPRRVTGSGARLAWRPVPGSP